MWQAQGGLADPFKGNAAHRRLAPAHGATLRDRAPVTAIRDAGGGDLEVVTPDATYRTGRVVLAADAWTNELLALVRPAPAADHHQGAGHLLRLPGPGAPSRPDRFPVWIWMDDPCFYGFPTYGEAGPKAAQDCGGQPVDPDRRGRSSATRPPSRGVEAFMADHLPGALGPPIYTKTCLYTLTPDRDFVVDRLPEAARRRRRPGRGPRLQVRVGHRPDPGRAEHRRLDPVGGRARPFPDRSADPARDRPRRPPGWSDRIAGARYGSAFARKRSLCHRTASSGRGGPT